MQILKRFIKTETPKQLFTISALTIGMLASGSVAAQSIKAAKLEIKLIDKYEKIWDDTGSGADVDVSFWRPKTTPGWHRVGHLVIQGHSPEQGSMVVKELVNGALANPTDYKLIWRDTGSGALKDVSVWRPVCPAGYGALGDVTSTRAMPSKSEIKCVLLSLLRKANADYATPIWKDIGSKADHNFGAWETNDGPANTGLFISVASHANPWSLEGRKIFPAIIWVFDTNKRNHYPYSF